MRGIAAPLVLGAMVLALSGCGVKRDLKPAAGQSLPPAPYGREESRPPSTLLRPHVQSAPSRSVELRQRSEDRADDPFDLPPSD